MEVLRFLFRCVASQKRFFLDNDLWTLPAPPPPLGVKNVKILKKSGDLRGSLRDPLQPCLFRPLKRLKYSEICLKGVKILHFPPFFSPLACLAAALDPLACLAAALGHLAWLT